MSKCKLFTIISIKWQMACRMFNQLNGIFRLFFSHFIYWFEVNCFFSRNFNMRCKMIFTLHYNFMIITTAGVLNMLAWFEGCWCEFYVWLYSLWYFFVFCAVFLIICMAFFIIHFSLNIYFMVFNNNHKKRCVSTCVVLRIFDVIATFYTCTHKHTHTHSLIHIQNVCLHVKKKKTSNEIFRKVCNNRLVWRI